MRGELDEPRWLAAPSLGFDNDPTGTGATSRWLVDAERKELSVSIVVPRDVGGVSTADAIYFGFTTDGTTGTLAKGAHLSLPTLGSDPRAVDVVQTYNYDLVAQPKWATPLGTPPWLKEATAWLDDPLADWGVELKVDLALAGLSTATSFRVQLAVHRQNEVTPAQSTNFSTPDPGAGALQSGSLFLADPSKWALVLPLDSACPSGVALSASQIGSRADASLTKIDTTPGVVNQLFARPSTPNSVALFEGLYQASFYLVPCGASAAANAKWQLLGSGVPNGAAPAPDLQTVELKCPVNTSTTTCGVPTPASGEHCLAVALAASPSQIVPFKTAVAFRAMDLGLETDAGGAGGAGGDGAVAAGGAGGAGDAEAGSPAGGSAGAPNQGRAGSSSAKPGGGESNQNAAGEPAVPSGEGGNARPRRRDDSIGCSCRAAGSPGARSVWVLALAASLAMSRRRRRS